MAAESTMNSLLTTTLGLRLGGSLCGSEIGVRCSEWGRRLVNRAKQGQEIELESMELRWRDTGHDLLAKHVDSFRSAKAQSPVPSRQAAESAYSQALGIALEPCCHVAKAHNGCDRAHLVGSESVALVREC